MNGVVLHLGNGFFVYSKDVVAIMDIEKASTQRYTREYLAAAGKAGRVVTCSYDLPKSFVVSLDKDLTERVYICAVAAQTLIKRLKTKDLK